MDVTLLRSFVAVATCGSFSAAADRLHLSQSSISHQVARLEAELGRRLFERTTRRCTLTVSGALLLDQAREVVQRLDEMRQQFRPDSLRGHIRLGVPDDAHLFMPIAAAVRELAAVQPQVSVNLRAGLSEDIRRAIQSGDLDLGIVRVLPAKPTSALVITEQLVWFGPSELTPRTREELPLAVVDEPCAYRRTAIEALVDAGIRHKIVISCSSASAVLAFVEAGLAVSVSVRALVPQHVPILGSANGLPALPTAGLAFRHAGTRPSTLARWLMPRLDQAITTAVRP